MQYFEYCYLNSIQHICTSLFLPHLKAEPFQVPNCLYRISWKKIIITRTQSHKDTVVPSTLPPVNHSASVD